MEEQWKVIPDFPNYEVGDQGHVRRVDTQKLLVPHKAKGNVWFVKLSRDGGAYSKTLKWLVAEAFVPHPEGVDPTLFDHPMQLVMNTEDVRAEKIVWRPLWFALKFRREMNVLPGYHDVPVMNLNTGNQHASILTAALHDGVLMKQIYRSAGEGVPTFPHMHRYEFMQNIWDKRPSVH